jgi:predicted kinase
MRLELLVGPIASGKSTYCRKAAKDGAIILNDDSIVTAVHGGDYRLYCESLKPLYKAVENSLLSTALAMGLRVVVDRPNHSVKMRRRFIGLAHSFDVPVTIVMFKRESPEVHGERRYLSDPRGYDLDYWVNVARYHDQVYEPPNQVVEHFDALTEWVFDPGCLC